jgi:hypothetical protein
METKADREARLKAALRDNLRKRKDRDRAQADAPVAVDGGTQGSENP